MDRILGLNNRKLQPLLAKQLKSKMFHRLYPSYNFSVRDFRDHLLCLSLRLIFWKFFSRKILRQQQTPGQNKSPDKSVLKLVKPFSGHCLAKRNQRCPKRPFISRPLGAASQIMALTCTQNKISRFRLLHFSFILASSFAYARYLLGFISVGKDFWKTFTFFFGLFD